MKIMHTAGELAGAIEEKDPEVARRLLVIGNARVPTADELAADDAARAEAEKAAKKSSKK